MNRKFPKYSSGAYIELNRTSSGKWVVILVDGDKRTSVRMYRWYWQCQLLLWAHSDLPIVRTGRRAVTSRVRGNVDRGMR